MTPCGDMDLSQCLTQVMACCLMAPSHYLDRCWLFIIEILWQSPENNFSVSAEATILYNEFKNYTFLSFHFWYVNIPQGEGVLHITFVIVPHLICAYYDDLISDLDLFYPRLVLAFGYCRCLRLCVSVCVCVKHLLVRVITWDPFKLGSPNLDQRCKRSWLRSL